MQIAIRQISITPPTDAPDEIRIMLMSVPVFSESESEVAIRMEVFLHLPSSAVHIFSWLSVFKLLTKSRIAIEGLKHVVLHDTEEKLAMECFNPAIVIYMWSVLGCDRLFGSIFTWIFNH